jgi:RHH-type proline utilization regulon transcriptional repressor/proline dehydrogenase/delta 1-pyrroline-5-carboxylate dehydrogenase
MAAALATGNRVLVLARSQVSSLTGLPALVTERTRFIGETELAVSDFQLALIQAGVKGELQTTLARRPGAIVSIVDTPEQGEIALWRLVAERAVCVNTTAAGGNASLMTLGL